MPNKKIINTTSKSYDNIKFKSILECSVYKYLKKEGYKASYEPDAFVLSESFYSHNYYKDGEKVKRKILKMTYTPDFKITINNINIYIEVKGFYNDVYPYKRKLFLNSIINKNIIFIETHSLKDLEKSLLLIKNEITK